MMYHPKSLIPKSFMNPIIRVFKLVSIFQKVLTKVVHIPALRLHRLNEISNFYKNLVLEKKMTVSRNFKNVLRIRLLLD